VRFTTKVLIIISFLAKVSYTLNLARSKYMVISVRTLMEGNFIRTTMDGKGWLFQYDRRVIAGR